MHIPEYFDSEDVFLAESIKFSVKFVNYLHRAFHDSFKILQGEKKAYILLEPQALVANPIYAKQHAEKHISQNGQLAAKMFSYHYLLEDRSSSLSPHLLEVAECRLQAACLNS